MYATLQSIFKMYVILLYSREWYEALLLNILNVPSIVPVWYVLMTDQNNRIYSSKCGTVPYIFVVTGKQ